MVPVASRTQPELVALAEEIRAQGGRAAYSVGSVTDPDAVSAALESMTDLFGGIDGAFNNAGRRLSNADIVDMPGRPGPAPSSTTAASGAGGYAAAKRAVNSLTATAAVEYGPEGIRVNAIAPGVTLTPGMRQVTGSQLERLNQTIGQAPLGRGAEPVEVAQAAAWLLSDRASDVTGIALPVDGGLRACALSIFKG